MSERNDNEIIQCVLQGKADDFEIILKRYNAYVFSIVSKHVPLEAAEEAAHEIFIRIYKSLPTYRAESPFAHWIAKISVRYCYDFWRERYKSKEVPMTSVTGEHAKWVEAAVSEQSHEYFAKEEALRESREVLQWALNKLPPEERMLITLLYFEEATMKEAADLLGWSVINVKVRAHRSRNKLRRILSSLVEQKEAAQ